MTQSIIAASTSRAIRRQAVALTVASALRAEQCAHELMQSFVSLENAFRAVTAHAPERFQLRDWQGGQMDSLERAGLYEQFVDQCADAIRRESKSAQQRSFWRDVQRRFASHVEHCSDQELYKAFFNAVTARAFEPRDWNHSTRFSMIGAHLERGEMRSAPLRKFACNGSLQQAMKQLLQAASLDASWADVDASAANIMNALDARSSAHFATNIRSLQLLDATFYQFTRAYLIGRIEAERETIPFVLELCNGAAGVVIEDVMLGEAAIARLFSGRAPFQAEMECVIDTAAYIKSLAPGLKTDKLFAMLGWPMEAPHAVVLG